MTTQDWTSDRNFHGYPAWERDLLGNAYGDYVPLFVDITAPAGGTLADGINAVLSSKTVQILPAEAETLQRELNYLQGAPLARVHALIYWPTDHIGPLPDYLHIRHVGGPIGQIRSKFVNPVWRHHLASVGQPESVPKMQSQAAQQPGPIIGIIDDDIGYLNSRFRRAGRTRFLAIWLQSGFADGTGAPGDVVLEAEDIQAEIDSPLAEQEIYAQRAAQLPPQERVVTGRRISHGTHVLDLAANQDGTRDLPVLAVQVPPAAVRATSGRRLETHVASGLRWIVTRALSGQVASAGLVVNLSLGALGGAGDDTTFLGNWMKDEIARYDRLSGTVGKMDIVAAYGNARVQRLVARGTLKPAQAQQLTWRVQPDDRSESMLEIRRDMAAEMMLTLRAPDRDEPVWRGPAPDAGQHHVLHRGQSLIGGLYGYTDSAGRPAVLVALAPTKRFDGGAEAPSGGWDLELSNTGGAPCDFSVKVQRDDTPGLYWQAGRQSTLDAPQGWIYDAQMGAYVAPAADNPITRAGTAVSFAGVQHAHIHLVSAFRPVAGSAGDVSAPPYSAEASDVTADDRPDISAQGDEGVMLRGIRAAGRFSGSSARLSGTSVAAPQVTAYLAGKARGTGRANDSAIAVGPDGGAAGMTRLGARRLPRR